MIKRLLLPLFVFQFLCSSAQDTTLQTNSGLTGREFDHWEIGLSFSPDYSYRVMNGWSSTKNFFSTRSSSNADSLNAVEHPALRWTAGIPIFCRFNRFIGIRTGVFISDKSYRSKGFVKSNGVYTGQWEVFKKNDWEKSPFLFIEIPLSATITVEPESRRMGAVLSAGASVCTNIADHNYDSRRWENIQAQHPELESSYVKLNEERFNIFYVGYTLGIKLSYKLNSNLALGVEPTYKFYGKQFRAYRDPYGTKPTGAYLPVKEQPFSYGLNLSLSFRG